MQYNKKDIPQFQEDVCKKTCILKGKCINEGKDDHWYLMCPHYFNWKIGYKSFISELLEYQRQHPEEFIENNKKKENKTKKKN